jgi:hypothetical protein
LDTVRIARDFGTVSELLPAGLSLLDAPFPIVGAIRMATVFISWRENLPSKEQPPKSIWLDGNKLESWFKDVEAKREAEMKGKGDKDHPEWDGEMKSNDAIKFMLVDDDD